MLRFQNRICMNLQYVVMHSAGNHSGKRWFGGSTIKLIMSAGIWMGKTCTMHTPTGSTKPTLSRRNITFPTTLRVFAPRRVWIIGKYVLIGHGLVVDVFPGVSNVWVIYDRFICIMLPLQFLAPVESVSPCQSMLGITCIGTGLQSRYQSILSGHGYRIAMWPWKCKGEEVEVLLNVRRCNLCLHLLTKILAHLRFKIWTDREYSKKLYTWNYQVPVGHLGTFHITHPGQWESPKCASDWKFNLRSSHCICHVVVAIWEDQQETSAQYPGWI